MKCWGKLMRGEKPFIYHARRVGFVVGVVSEEARG